MAARNILSQQNIVEVASLSDSGAAFIGFGAKADGLYMKNGASSDLRLLTVGDVGINVTQTAHNFTAGTAIKSTASGWVKTKADSSSNAGTSAIVSAVVDANNFKAISEGKLAGTFTAGADYYLSTSVLGAIVTHEDSEAWNVGEVCEYLGTSSPDGSYLMVEIDAGFEIDQPIVDKMVIGAAFDTTTRELTLTRSAGLANITTTIPHSSIWNLTGVNRAGWGEGKVLKFNSSGDLIVGVDLQTSGGTGLSLTDLSASSPLSYNPLTGVFSVATGYTIPTTTEKGQYDMAYGWGNHANYGYASNGHNHSGVYEPVHGNPASNGYVLSSTTGGVRSWVAMSSGMVYPSAGIPVSTGSAWSNTVWGVEYGCTSGENYKLSTSGGIYAHISSRLTGYEPVLGNPASSGYVLSSTTGGVRSWVAMSGGSDGNNYPTNLSFNYQTGDLTITRNGLSSLVYSLNGRYATLSGSNSQAFWTANLNVTGTISASSTITGSEVYRGSSRTLKNNIREFEFGAMDFLNNVQIVQYNLKSNEAFGIGFIAEDTHPWLSGEDQKSHNFGNHLGILTKAIQEEDLKIGALRLEILDLKARIKEIEIETWHGRNE